MISLIRYLVPSGKEDGAARELREDDEDDDPVHVFGQVIDAVIRNGCVEARVMPGINSSPLDRWRQMKSSRQMQRVADERVAAAFSDTLPLADDLKRLSTARYLLNVQANILALGAVVLLGGEFALIAAMPDDNPVLLSVQVVTGLLAGGGAVILLATSFLVRGMSLAPAHDNGVELSTVVVEGAVVGECNGVYHPSPDDHPADGQPFYCNQHGATIGWSDASSPPPSPPAHLSVLLRHHPRGTKEPANHHDLARAGRRGAPCGVGGVLVAARRAFSPYFVVHASRPEP